MLRRNWGKLAAIAIVPVLALVIGSNALAGGCKSVTGTFHEDAVSSLSSPPCTTAANGLCTMGRIIGGIQGTYNFALSGDNEKKGGAASLGDKTFPSSVIHFTGRDVIQTKDGDLFGAEAGALDTTSPGNYADLMTITGGTGVFAGAFGQIHFFGNFDLATGTGDSQYSGVVCTP